MPARNDEGERCIHVYQREMVSSCIHPFRQVDIESNLRVLSQFECPFEGNSEYSDVTSVDYAFEDESDAVSENHPYGHHPEIVYDSDTSTVETDYPESSAIFTDPEAGERSDSSSSESETEEGEVVEAAVDNGSSIHDDEIILVEEIHT